MFRFFGRRHRKETVAAPEYCFCESISAPPGAFWHIRKLSDAGPKYGGGVDTPALCGRVVTWDLIVPITPHLLVDICQACADLYKEQPTLPETG